MTLGFFMRNQTDQSAANHSFLMRSLHVQKVKGQTAAEVFIEGHCVMFAARWFRKPLRLCGVLALGKCLHLTAAVFVCCSGMIRISTPSSTHDPPPFPPAFPTSCPERLSSSQSWQKWTRLDGERTQPGLLPSRLSRDRGVRGLTRRFLGSRRDTDTAIKARKVFRLSKQRCRSIDLHKRSVIHEANTPEAHLHLHSLQ